MHGSSKYVLESNIVCRSFIIRTKSTGPSVVPCGTPPSWLVFTLDKEYRLRHRVLCVVVLSFVNSLCSLCCVCSICVKKCSHNCVRLSFREVCCAIANASIYGVFGYMVFIARPCTRSISLWRTDMSDVNHAGHTYCNGGWTTVVYAVTRTSMGMFLIV